ncbi:MAG: multicopper oxidase domain-containing protein [Nitrospirae bacterium]|nr:multicopper oxidase domain-containing protein [Nitrospirota bacterium]
MAIKIISREHINTDDPMEAAEFNKFICPPKENPDTPDRLTPDVTFYRKLMVGLDLNLPVPLPDGTDKVQMQVIADNAPSDRLPEQFPAPLIRVVQGQIVHTVVDGGQAGHTIHHHGIEPTPMNDGVGKDSFELGAYTYQWQPRHAGTYFYHCHKNTTLHVELGMYGPLIVDPPQGAGFVAAFNPPDHVMQYDVEALWAADEIDPRWHDLQHNAFMSHCGADPNNADTFTSDGILHDFRPTVFVITGAVRKDDSTPITDPRVAINAQVGETILLRVVNAGYTVQRFTLGIDADVIAMDGRALGVPPSGKYSFPFSIPSGTPFSLTSARRWDLIIRPAAAGVYPAQVEFLDWITGERYAIARTLITVV